MTGDSHQVVYVMQGITACHRQNLKIRNDRQNGFCRGTRVPTPLQLCCSRDALTDTEYMIDIDSRIVPQDRPSPALRFDQMTSHYNVSGLLYIARDRLLTSRAPFTVTHLSQPADHISDYHHIANTPAKLGSQGVSASDRSFLFR